MPFCRRCGDIVVGPRCKCGGAAVAPSVQFSQATSEQARPDHWSRTYVARDKSPEHHSPNQPAFRDKHPVDLKEPVRKFPRPHSTNSSTTPLPNRVSSHIQSTFTYRPTSPLKQASTSDEPPSPHAADILPSPYTSTLSKAYGSVLQPKETLSTFNCFLCASTFPPDATIYPDPTSSLATSRFLCKPCFIENGGSKGECTSCSRPVLILASEGGFVENSGKIWHKRCFRCDGCFKDIGDKPMVDLLGRPSCEECFESCLKRPARDNPRRYSGTPGKTERSSNLGGVKGANNEGSPAMDELHQRLGIRTRESSPAVGELNQRLEIKSRENSPAIEDLTQRLTKLHTGTPSPIPRREVYRNPLSEDFKGSKPEVVSKGSSSPAVKPNEDAIEEMRKRFLRRSTSTPTISSLSPPPYSSTVEQSESSFSQDLTSIAPSTPDLVSDYSDTATQSSPPSTPTSQSPPRRRTSHSNETTNTPTPKSRNIIDLTIVESPQTPCTKCHKPLFKSKGGGRFVTVPEESSKCLPPKTYHVECFRCAVCDDTFEETRGRQAMFVRSSTGYCHVGCATPERIVVRPMPRLSTTTPSPVSSSPHDRPPKTAPSSITSFPRFGSSTACPGCHHSVSPMEKGVVPGPQGSRWHASCLVCGGKGAVRGRRDSNQPGCGKRLDSAAKSDGDGGVWCRECLSLLPTSSPQGSPTRSPLSASHTGGIFRTRNDSVAPQFTGGTTIARQFTGLGQGSISLQLTGGGLSPTRQLMTRSPSPTKLAGGGRMFPRPKSVVGIRGHKSVDEGRGMFLVRQMTGGHGI